MARIIPVDVIKGISGKYGNNSDTYFATNTTSNKVRLAKLSNPYQGPSTEKQLAQQAKFAARQAAASAWLNANKPTDLSAAKGTREHDGTAAYVLAKRLKQSYGLSNITQVVYKYMNEQNEVKLPGMN